MLYFSSMYVILSENMTEPTWYAVLVLDAFKIQTINHIVEPLEQDNHSIVTEPSTNADTGNTGGGRKINFTRISDHNYSKVKLYAY